MARRTVLRGIAKSLAQSFASRNNDAGGYWGVGILYKHALSLGSHELVIDLLSPGEPAGAGSDIHTIAEQFASLLGRLLETSCLRRAVLTKASIRVRFGIPEEELTMYERFGRGVAFGCLVELQDDLSHQYCGEARGRVAAHDPSRETRSARYGVTEQLIEPPGRPSIRCEKCEATVVWPADLSALVAAECSANRS
jgi:hypothetical protein